MDHQGQTGGEVADVLKENNDCVYHRVCEFWGGQELTLCSVSLVPGPQNFF